MKLEGRLMPWRTRKRGTRLTVRYLPAARLPRPHLRDPIVIAPEGELDLARLGEFRRQLFAAVREQAPRVVVDLTEVSFIDSSALSGLLELKRQLRRVNGQLAVVAPSGSAVAVVLGLTGLRDRLPMYETRESALGS